jgi:hypothetical protein
VAYEVVRRQHAGDPPFGVSMTSVAEVRYLYQVRASEALVKTTVVAASIGVNGDCRHDAANLGPATFTDDPSAPGTLIKADHIVELRTQLDDAWLHIGVPALIYAQPIIAGTTLIKVGDVTELRAGAQ